MIIKNNSFQNSSVVKNENHLVISNWRKVVIRESGYYNFKDSVGKTISISFDGRNEQFHIVERITAGITCHDCKLKLRRMSDKKEMTLWSRDLKQGDIGKLFKY